VKAILLIDIGSTYTKVVAADIDSECVVGTAKAFTTVRTDINEGLEQAVDELRQVTGISRFAEKFACSSAAGGLKMVAVGLVPDLTAEAARMAALSAGARVMKTFSYELSDREIAQIHDLKPDIILLTGGTDGGNRNIVLHNAKKLAETEVEISVVVACNKSVLDDAGRILADGGKDVRLCENVMPEFNVLNIVPAREMIRSVFLEKIIRAKGLTRVRELVEDILMPTPAAVLKAAGLLASGTGSVKGFGDLLVVDVGGATTDVYSITDGSPDAAGVIVKGLPEPYEKRTVEGDLGVRYNAAALADAAGIEAVAAGAGMASEEVNRLIEMIGAKPELLCGDNEKIGLLDNALASQAVRLAVERHAGRISSAFTAFGEVFVQTGKNLGRVRKVIGTGGPVINGTDQEKILHEALFDKNHPEVLKPVRAEILLDRKYIMAAMGLLGLKYPDTALKIMKRELEMI